jgi:hypothetical protein
MGTSENEMPAPAGISFLTMTLHHFLIFFFHHTHQVSWEKKTPFFTPCNTLGCGHYQN